MRDIGMFEKKPLRPRSVLDNSYMISSIDGGLVCVFQNGRRYNVFVETISEAAPIIKHLSLTVAGGFASLPDDRLYKWKVEPVENLAAGKKSFDQCMRSSDKLSINKGSLENIESFMQKLTAVSCMVDEVQSSLIKAYSDSFDGKKLLLEEHPPLPSCALM